MDEVLEALAVAVVDSVAAAVASAAVAAEQDRKKRVRKPYALYFI